MTLPDVVDPGPAADRAPSRSRGRSVALLLLALTAAGLFVPALLLTGTRLVAEVTGTDVGTVVRLQSFAPLGLPLYAVLGLLLAGPALRGRARRRWWRAGLAAAAGGLALHAWWWSPQVLGETPEPAPGAERVVVMSANLLAGSGDATALVEEARRRGAALLVVQEITDSSLAAMDAAGVADLLPHRVGEPARDHDVAGTMIFSRTAMTDLERLPTRFGSYSVSVGGLTLLGVHPVAPVDGAEWRTDQETVRAAAVAADADLVVGDLNATNDHEPLQALHDDGFRDAAELANAGWQPTWPANHLGIVPALPPVVAIDHVLLGPRLTALDTDTVVLAGTDHKALVATVARRS
ncbi:endonuclease/exonuclease/phosphatase family protein [Nocardioides sp. SYSU D00038]|uniref:endonuclease/exonuclease/phosphatase family protein n=1 Tax=Nocardioides sp. SYSU D00038 TaxID=2812554 RepID=UPI001967011E|nr:endonuclease/exonuclease/phosphatase family protein [Nocardioides sp. SYSU D00038]